MEFGVVSNMFIGGVWGARASGGQLQGIQGACVWGGHLHGGVWSVELENGGSVKHCGKKWGEVASCGRSLLI